MQSVLYELHVSQSQFSHCPRQIWMAWLQMEPTILALWWYSSRRYSGASSWMLGLEDGCTSDQFIGGSVGNRWSLLKNGLENRLKSVFCLNYSDTQDSMILKLMISWKNIGCLWSWRILFASWSVLTRVHMNNYCTGQWNAKDENINDHASYWPIVGILKARI